MICETSLAYVIRDILIEPLDDGILDLAHSIQICKVLLSFVSVRGQVLIAVVIADVFLFWNHLEDDRLPLDGSGVDYSHEGHHSHRDFNVVLSADGHCWHGVGSHVARSMELSFLFVHPLPSC